MYGVDLYRRVRLACHREGLSGREAGRRFGIDRKTVAKILGHSVPPGYRRSPWRGARFETLRRSFLKSAVRIRGQYGRN